jgi:hypothetical protein
MARNRHQANFHDLTGRQFGRWTVLGLAPDVRPGITRWLCRCQCGKERSVLGSSLPSGTSRSCGCLKNEIQGHEGQSKCPEGSSWMAMIRRCTRISHPDYVDYGGRGIKVCDRWRLSFQAFLEDMGPKPSRHHSIERKENSGNYEPGNCRWATAKEQARNRRSNWMITYNGESKSVAEWAELVGIMADTLEKRLRKGWPVSRAIMTPVRPWVSKGRQSIIR